MSMAPVAPIGWPSAIAPPFTFTRSGSSSRSRIVLSGTAANASLTSHRSMSVTYIPALAEAALGCRAGRCEHDHGLRSDRGRGPDACSWRHAVGRAPTGLSATSAAAAPSTTPEEFPAWCTWSIRSTFGYRDSAISS